MDAARMNDSIFVIHMEKDTLQQLMAITQIPGVGNSTTRRLISYCGGIASVMKESYSALKKIPGVSHRLAAAIVDCRNNEQVANEVIFMEKQGIRAIGFLDKDYPERLRHCEDGPVLIFTKGSGDLNHPKVLGIVGARNMTPYGREQCTALVEALLPYDPLIVSGLAYGVDACAHQAALTTGLHTAAVLGHGLDMIYPAVHKPLASRIMGQGLLVTEFLSGTRPERENFPKRNRIIAGLCDAVIVIEAAVTGGALITANIANSYNRDVFALPGKTTDTYSQGCNKLIKTNKAHLTESVRDLEYIMNWEKSPKSKICQQQLLFVTLDDEEKALVDFVRDHPGANIDQVVAGTVFNLSSASSILLNLEFKGVLEVLPGKAFKLKK